MAKKKAKKSSKRAKTKKPGSRGGGMRLSVDSKGTVYTSYGNKDSSV